MYFSRVRLDAQRVSAADLGRMVQGNQYAGHQLLWRLFSTGEGGDRDQPRPFLFRQVEDSMPTFYLVSSRQPVDRRNYWQIETKLYEPALSSGMRLQFDLRANPVKRSKQPDGRHKRHDVVMHAKHHRHDDGGQADPRDLERRAGWAWLRERAESLGFRVDDEHFAADGYQQHRIHKRSGSPIRFSSLDMRGLVEIIDVNTFRQTLFNGVGPSKSFGCGLLLIRPA